ncbi:39S ribosomal protein L40, mitochondrial [Lingula anatina]|uniref:Large ribosomal subunit protein mL40 n=1 Tax=Lingula anatina TaxID=7574 RepID=A0A1S3IMS1_LINAN|nr:39S ribosomal protein L40, mitochondrial [Lingula anatina]|eukprot:XP_013399535.1 39S ribosomal protein L40, mitochondrial [Lingula anatina]
MALSTEQKAAVQLSRLFISRCSPGSYLTRAISTKSTPDCFRISLQVNSGPPVKKVHVDHRILTPARQEKLAKEREKLMRRLEKNAGQKKPIEEVDNWQLQSQLMTRARWSVITPEAQETRAVLLRDWSRYRFIEHKKVNKAINIARASRDRALLELQKESEELYQKAIQPDKTLTPYTFKGPKHSPPIPGYQPEDGFWEDATPTYETPEELKQFKI